MNRCARRPLGLRGRALAAALTCAFALLPAIGLAQHRGFPEHALRGLMVVGTPPDISINGKAERLSPGARIRNTNNTIVFANSLIGEKLVVNYVRESNGMVHEVWILNGFEQAQPRAGASDMVIHNYRSGSDAESPPNTR
ncbi:MULTISPECIES: hypothetical protein [Hydrogenophaga]|uniref:Pilus formation protein N-terminal domain-containing protein n=2 Tax=Hydrogenophaga TaxID=47420 RepID=A0ABW2QJX5_9BURK